MLRITCFICYRASVEKGILLHKFPDPEKFKDLWKEWGRVLKMGKIPKIAHCCSAHFSADDYKSEWNEIAEQLQLAVYVTN